MKIAINRCFGGFGLSDEAFERYLELKGIEYETSPSNWSFTKGAKDYWHRGHVGENDHYLFCRDVDRDDPALIQAIEEFGDNASGKWANVAIVDVPDDVKWHIAEYDGYEHVAEDHRTWS